MFDAVSGLMIGSYIVVYVNGLRGFHDPLHL